MEASAKVLGSSRWTAGTVADTGTASVWVPVQNTCLQSDDSTQAQTGHEVADLQLKGLSCNGDAMSTSHRD